MASVIRGSDNFDSEGIVTGTAKAWVNFNGIGTVAIRDSYNVSSITDNGTGDYTVNYSNALPDTNYVFSAAAGSNTSASNTAVQIFRTYTTTSIRLVTANTSYNNGDAGDIAVIIFGN